MRLKRALLCGALLWVLIFFEVSILMFGFKIVGGGLYYTIHYIMLIILASLSALIYFRGRVDRGLGQGLLVGLVMVLTGIVLDAIITVPLFTKNYAAFFKDIYLLIGMVETVIVAGVVGMFRR